MVSPTTAKLLAIDCFRMSKTVDDLPAASTRIQLAFHYLHSLCNAVGRQHSPRKPRRGAGRLSTSPDTKIINYTKLYLLTLL